MTPLLVGAAVLAVLALGLPWAAAGAGGYLPGSWMPGWCYNVTDSDGYVSTYCTADSWYFGITLGNSAGRTGAQSAARVFIVLVSAATAIALKRASRHWAIAAVALAGAGLVLGGIGARPGQLAYLAAGILLVFALSKAGLLSSGPFSMGPRSAGRRSTGSRSAELRSAELRSTGPRPAELRSTGPRPTGPRPAA